MITKITDNIYINLDMLTYATFDKKDNIVIWKIDGCTERFVMSLTLEPDLWKKFVHAINEYNKRDCNEKDGRCY